MAKKVAQKKKSKSSERVEIYKFTMNKDQIKKAGGMEKILQICRNFHSNLLKRTR